MHSLERTVRLSILPPAHRSGAIARNSWAGVPGPVGLAVHAELSVEVVGEPDPQSGYVLSIQEIDEAVRAVAGPGLERALDESWRADRPEAVADPIATLVEIGPAVAARIDARGGRRQVRRIEWRASPYRAFSLAFRAAPAAHPTMPPTIAHAEVTVEFEFAAAHRLHCPDLDEAANRALFGKCNHPHGHGHNYRVEVAVRVPPVRLPFPIAELERIVDETVIRRFDHKNLNMDCPEFANLNPSVEHIARTCHDLLVAPVAATGGALAAVTVWETGKTRCRYPAAED
jgi:6-pyruvoyltetrahydropterin/6-carboxytetrahydropterin synthase